MKQQTLREWRTERELTQEQLERKCAETPTAIERNVQLTQTAISGIEVGKVVNPNWSTVLILAEALNIDPRALRFGDSPSRRQTRLPLKRKLA